MNNGDAASGGRIIYDLTANLRPFEEGLSQAEKSAKKTGDAIKEGFSSGASGAAKSMSKLSNQVLSSVGQMAKGLASISWNALTTGAATALTSLTATAKKAISDTQGLEAASIQMQSFTGSLEKGNQAMAAAYTFFKNNPFNRFVTVDAVKNMVQFGAAMEDIPEQLKILGDISLSTGADLSDLASIYQRSLADNKIGLMDLEVLANRGVPVYKGFQEALGMTASQVRELTGAGALTGDMLKKVFKYLSDNAGPAMAQFEQTLARQQDRLAGGFSNLRGLLAGYTVTTNGLEIANNGLYGSFVALETEFVNIFRGTKITAEQYEKLSPLMKKFVDDAGGVEAYSARNAAVAEKLNSAMTELGVVLAEILVKIADKLPGIIDGVATVFKFLADHSSALIPVATMALVAFGKIGATLPGVGGLVGAFAQSVNLLTRGLTNLGKTLGSALLTKLGMFSKSAKAATTATQSLGAAGKISGIAGKAVTSGLIPAIKGLASVLPLALKASAVIAVIGAAIGAFIGAIGAGIWLFGEGLAAIGRGFSSLATGIGELNKVEADNIPTVIKKLAKALGGLFWQLGDFAVAAVTFKGIGEGLQEIAKALGMLKDFDESDLKILKPLARGLKEFQIGLFDNIFGGNVISKFKDLGNSIQYIAELINVISDIKIEDEKLKKTMSSLAEGLKAFMITELRPGYLGKLWVDIDYKSVTDYMTSLKDIIQPLNDLYELMNKKKFDGQAMSDLLKNLAESFKAFQVVEVHLSQVGQFLYGDIDYVSVLKYVENLGNIIQPLNDLYTLMTRSKFDSNQFTDLIANLGESFKSFQTAELKPSDINKFFIGDINYESVLKYVENLEQLIKPLNDLYSLMSRNNFDPEVFTRFVNDLGSALHSFITVTTSKEISVGFMNAHYADIDTTSVLDYMTNFGTVVEDLSSLNNLLQKERFNADEFVKFVRDIGEALQAFVTTDFEQTVDIYPLRAKYANRNFGSVLEYMDQFKTLVSALTDLNQSFSQENSIEPDKIAKFVKDIAEALSATVFDANSDTIEGGVGFFNIDFKKETKVRESVFEHLSQFKDFVSAIKPLLEIEGIGDAKNFSVKRIQGFMVALIEAVSNSTFESVADTLNIGGKVSLFSGNVNVSKENRIRESIFEHLDQFGDFVSAIKPLLEIEGINEKDNYSVKRLQSFMVELIEAVAGSTFEAYKDSNNFGLKGSLFSGSLNNSSEQTTRESIFEHLKDFKKFADSIAPLLQIKGIGDENNQTVKRIKNLMVSLIGAVASSTFESESYTKSLGAEAGLFNGKINYSEEKKIQSSIFEHLSQFKEFTEAIAPLLTITLPEGVNEAGRFKNVQTFMKSVIGILKESTFETSSATQEIEGSLGFLKGNIDISSEKKTQDSIFDHLSQFKDFADSLLPFLTIQFAEGVDAEATFKNVSTFMQAVISAVSGSTFENSNEILEGNGSGWSALVAGSFKIDASKETKTRESIFEHLKDFKSFADSLLPFLNIKFDKDVDPKKLFESVQNFMVAVIGAVNGSTFATSEKTLKAGGSGWGALVAGGVNFDFSNEEKTYDSIFNHMQHFKEFATSLEPLLKIPGIGDEKNDTATRITNFMETVIDVLNSSAFLTSDSDKRSGGYLEGGLLGASGNYNQSEVQHTYDSIFNHISGFKDFATSLTPMLQITGIGKEDDHTAERVTSFMKTVIKVLLQSNFQTSDAWAKSGSKGSWKNWESSEKSGQKTYDSIFNHISGFKDFADSLKPLLEIKDLGKEKVDSLKTFIKELIEVLNLSVFNLDSENSESSASGEINVQGLSATGNFESKAEDSKRTRDSIFNHLGDFKGFTEGLKTLLEIQELPKEKIDNLKTFIIDLSSVLYMTANMKTSESSSYDNTYEDGVHLSGDESATYDSIFNHLQHFKSFAEGVAIIVGLLPSLTEDNMKTIDSFMTNLFTALRGTTMTTGASQEQQIKALFISGSENTQYTYDTIFNHMEHFEEFANGMATIMGAIGQENFDPEKFSTTISAMFGSLRSLALEEKKTNEETRGIFGTGSSSEESTTFNMDILNHLEDLKKLAEALQMFVGLGIGTDKELGTNFSTTFSSIAESFQKLAPLSEIAWENIDTEAMKNLATVLTDYKTLLTEWNTESIAAQAEAISLFFKTVIELFNNTEEITAVVENAKLLGTALSESIITGLKNQAEVFSSNFKEFIVAQTAAGFQSGQIDIENATRTHFVEVISQYVSTQNSEILSQAAKDGIITVMLNAFADEKTRISDSVANDIIKVITDKITQSEQTFKDSGKYMTEGLAKGLNEEIWRINGAIGNISSAAIETLRKLLGIASPSKVFYEMGSFMGQGLVNGLTDMATEVAEATESLVDSINTELDDINVVDLSSKVTSGVSGDGSSSSQTVKNITVNNNNSISNGLDMSSFLSRLQWDITRA